MNNPRYQCLACGQIWTQSQLIGGHCGDVCCAGNVSAFNPGSAGEQVQHQVLKAEMEYQCQISTKSGELLLTHEGTNYPLDPRTATLSLVQLTPVPRPVKQFIETIIALQEAKRFRILATSNPIGRFALRFAS